MGAKDRLKHLMAMRAEREIARETPTHELNDDVRRKIATEVETALQRREHVSAVVGRLSKELKTPSPSPAVGAAPLSQKGKPQPASLASPSPAGPSGRYSAPPHLASRNVAPTPHIPVPIDGPQPDLWASIARQAYQEQLEHQAAERLARAERIRRQREVLDEQVATRKRIKSLKVVEQRTERQQLEALKTTWEAEQRAAEQQHREIAERLRGDREGQVAERERRRAAEAEERHRADEAILRRIEAEMVAQKARAQALKEREVRMKEELVAANEVQKAIKAELRAHDEELEARCLREMAEREEKQARDRQRAWDAMKEKMRGREALALELQATIDERAAADEARAASVTEARWREKEAREHAEAAQRKQGLLRVFEFQCKQIEEKHRLAEEERRAKEVEKAQAARIVEENRAILEQRRREERERIEKQRRILEEQLRENAHYHTVVISEEEQKLNKEILNRAAGIESPSRFKRTFSPI